MKRIARWVLLCGLMMTLLSLMCLAQSAQEGTRDARGTRTDRSEGDSEQRASVEQIREDSTGSRENDELPASFAVDLFAAKGFKFSYGIGDAFGLSSLGGGGGDLRIDQSLSVEFSATALDSISVVAKLDDQQPSALQNLGVYLDTDRLDGILGDFSLDRFGSAIADRKMLGLRLDYAAAQGVRVSGFVSAPEGTLVSREFEGEKATDVVLFARYRSDETWVPTTYRFNVDGLAAFSLVDPFAEGFTDVQFMWVDSDEVESILAGYGLASIQADLGQVPPSVLPASAYIVLPGDVQMLILLTDPQIMMRQMIQTAIEAYNLRVNEAKVLSYPFKAGSVSELAFLGDLAEFAKLLVGERSYDFDSAVRQQYYLMNRSGVIEDSVRAFVSDDGVMFSPIGDLQLESYDTQIFAEQGVLKVQFPQEFFNWMTPFIKVEFSYALAMGFSLGGRNAVIPGSERVYLNGVLLQADVDYDIDYEIGLVTLRHEYEVGESDVVQVDFEIYGAGTGDDANYATYIYGAQVEVPFLENVELKVGMARSWQDDGSVDDPTKVATLPNSQFVLWADCDIDLGMAVAHLETGYCWDEAPFDNNQKPHKQNRITAIAAISDGMVFFGHMAGLSTYDGASWRSYGTVSHLPSTRIQALAVTPQSDLLLIGTDQGLSAVRLDALDPLAFGDNWSTYRVTNGLPGNDVRAIMVSEDGTLWVATSNGLASIALKDLGSGEGWIRYQEQPGMEMLGMITVLREGESGLLIGTTHGAYIWEDRSASVARLDGTMGQLIYDILVLPDRYMVASDRGLREYVNGYPGQWVLEGSAVQCVESDGTQLWYGTSQGLRSTASDVAELGGSDVTRLTWQSGTGLWVGSQADSTSGLTIWLENGSITSFHDELTKIPAEDPVAYQSVLRSDRLIEGFGASGSIRQWSDVHQLELEIYRFDRGFRQIGSIKRPDERGWNLSGEADLGYDATIEARHRYIMFGEIENALATSWSQADLTWRDVQLSFNLDTADYDALSRGPEEHSLSVSADVDEWQLLDEDLIIDLSWGFTREKSRDARRPTSRQSTEIDVNWNGWETIRLGGAWISDWQLLGGERRESGSELSLDGTWNLPLVFGNLRMVYGAEATFSLSGTGVEWDHEGSLTWSAPSLSGELWSLSSGKLGGTWQLADKDRYSALANAVFSVGPWNIDTRVRHSLADLGKQQDDISDSIEVRVTADGLSTWKPAISATVSNRRLVHTERTSDTLDVNLIGSVDWIALIQGVTDRTDIRWKASYANRVAKSKRVELNNNYSSDVSSTARVWLSRMAGQRMAEDVNFKLVAQSGLAYVVDRGTFRDVTVKTTLGLAVSGEAGWSASFNLGGSTGLRADGTWFRGVLATLEFDIPFKYSERY